MIKKSSLMPPWKTMMKKFFKESMKKLPILKTQLNWPGQPSINSNRKKSSSMRRWTKNLGKSRSSMISWRCPLSIKLPKLPLENQLKRRFILNTIWPSLSVWTRTSPKPFLDIGRVFSQQLLFLSAKKMMRSWIIVLESSATLISKKKVNPQLKQLRLHFTSKRTKLSQTMNSQSKSKEKVINSP